MHDERLDIIVPMRGGCRLADLLYPVVAEIQFSPPPPWNVLVGQWLDVYPTVIASSYAILDPPADGDVHYATGNPAVAAVTMLPGCIRIAGVAPGSTTLDLTRYDTSIKRIPDLPIVGTGGAINVM
jgi:hypothetical protein